MNVKNMYQTNTYNNKFKLTNNHPAKKIALLGVAPIAENIYKNLHSFENIVGFINIGCTEGFRDITESPAVLGGVDEIRSIVQKHHIDKILLAIDPTDSQQFSNAIRACKRENLEFILPESNGTAESQSAFPEGGIYNNSKMYENFLMTLLEDETPVKGLRIQRVVDLIVSALLFLIFLPSWVVVAIAIKLESKGGVLYSQERVGKGGKIFRIYKFRSMYADAEKRGGPQLATQNDPRITRVGRILRKTRIDELPQLFNVLKGNMSLVGPRPERPYFVEKYRREIPNYILRLKVKPGLTGYAQVESGYDETIEDVKIKLAYDLYYIEHADSWKLYFWILTKTIWVVLTARGQ